MEVKKRKRLEIQILPCLFSDSVAKRVRKSQDVRSFFLCLFSMVSTYEGEEDRNPMDYERRQAKSSYINMLYLNGKKEKLLIFSISKTILCQRGI